MWERSVVGRELGQAAKDIASLQQNWTEGTERSEAVQGKEREANVKKVRLGASSLAVVPA